MKAALAIRCTLAASTLLLGACETLPSRADGCLPGFNPRGAEPLRVTRSGAKTVEVNDDAPCRRHPNGHESAYRVLELPPFERPYYVQLVSQTVDGELFPPILATLDARAEPVRALDPDRYVYRGDRLTGTLFFNAENAGERYLAVMSNPHQAGDSAARREQGQQRISFVIGAWYGGEDRKVQVRLSEFGQVQLRARPDPSVAD